MIVQCAPETALLASSDMCSSRSCTVITYGHGSARNPEKMRDVDHVALQALQHARKSRLPLIVSLRRLQRGSVKVRRQRANFRHLCREPMRKYLLSRSRRPRVRTTLRMYVPMPNSVMRRMSMATFTDGI